MDETHTENGEPETQTQKPPENPPLPAPHGTGTGEQERPVGSQPTGSSENHAKPSLWQRIKEWWVKGLEPGTLSERIIALFTIVIAIIGIGQYVVFQKQLDVFGKQLKEMQGTGVQTDKIIDADNRLAAANERFAGAMENSNKQSKDALGRTLDQSKQSLDATIAQGRLDQRAWVGISGFEKPVFEVGKEFTVRAAMKNTGKTPALKARLSAVLNPTGKGIMPDLDDLTDATAKGLIPPNDFLYFTMSGTANRGISQPGIDAIKNGDQVVFVYGILRYSDVFGAEHWTKFCDILNPKTMEFDLCGTGNDIDRPSQSQHAKKAN